MFGPDGLLVGFNQSFPVVFAAYLLLTPLLPYVFIAPLLESRWLPFNLRRQFATFVVGDVLLALSAALMTISNQSGEFKRIPAWIMLSVLAITIAVSIVITKGEYTAATRGDEFAYEPRAVISPTKLYHNIVLYAGYAFVLVMLLIEMILQGAGLSKVLLALIPAIGWAITLVLEEKLTSDDVRRSRARNAHIASWSYLWSPPYSR